MLFEDPAFIRFVDAVAKLNTDNITWARTTEGSFEYLSKNQLREKVKVFNETNMGKPVMLHAKWLEFLSMSSRYWEPENLG